MSRFLLITFGCQMNEHDSERMAGMLVRGGHVPATSLQDAEVVILNTCSVRDKAVQKLKSELGRLSITKRAKPDLLLIAAGCVAQQEQENLLRAVPALDLVMGPDRIAELVELLADLEQGGPRRVAVGFDTDQPRFLAPAPAAGRRAPAAYVTVMKGCNERCSFCIVPTTRGPERYRPARQIIDEIRKLVAEGVREVTLLGQTVNSYRDPEGTLPRPDVVPYAWQHTPGEHARSDETEFPSLLVAVAAAVPELVRLRYTSPHPRHLTAGLIAAHRELPVLVRHLHLPVQSGSNRVLRRMVRRHTVEEYLERTETLMSAVPGLTLSTDVIVGFPGETPEDVEATLALIRRLRFVGLFGFKYSPRPHTPALRLGDDVPEDEKARRLAQVFEQAARLRANHLASLVGAEEWVLVEGRNEDGAYTGRTERNEIVHWGARRDRTGELVKVRIVRQFKNSLGGELDDPEERLPISDLPRLRAVSRQPSLLPVIP